MSINRGLLALGYELHESRGKTRNGRRRVDLDPTTVTILEAWRAWQRAEHTEVGLAAPDWVFTTADGQPVHPHAISQAFERIARRAILPMIRCRHNAKLRAQCFSLRFRRRGSMGRIRHGRAADDASTTKPTPFVGYIEDTPIRR